MPRKSRKNVGVIGLGLIGTRVVAALRGAGFHVYVWNRTPRVMPNFLASPAEVAEVCDVIQFFISDAQALFELLDGLLDSLTERHLIICSATVGPEATIEAAKLVEERGAAFLDAPFTGSKTAAEKRALVYFVGGTDEANTRAESVLAASAKTQVRVGKIGDAATLKVATNMLAAVTVQTAAEALAVVRRSGIAPSTLLDVLENHGVRSPLLDVKLPAMMKRDYEPHFSMKHMFKDVQLAIHVANSLDIDIPATTATAGVMYGSLNRGWAELDYSALAKVYGDEDEEVSAGEAEENVPPEVKAEGALIATPHTAPAGSDEPPKESLNQIAAAAIATAGEPAKPGDGMAPPTAPQDAPLPTLSTPRIIEVSDQPAPITTDKTTAPLPDAAAKGKTTAPPINRFRRWFAKQSGNS